MKLSLENIHKAILDNAPLLEHLSEVMQTSESELKSILNPNDNLISKKNKAIIYVDGGSRGNPGIAGCGITIQTLNHKIGYYYYIGIATNNVAEYTALIKALTIAQKEFITDVQVFSDSELVIKQVNGQYKIKNEKLIELNNEVLVLKSSFNSFKISHIRREKNTQADALANEAMNTKKNGKTELTVAL